MRVLVVEDEVKMAALVRRGLEREGYAVDIAGDGAEALWAAREQDYDAIVLDAMIPGPDGFAVCRTLRDEGRWSPVLMLTARDSVEDRVRGLDAGADDYLTKPFALPELEARVRALTRRGTGQPRCIEIGQLSYDQADRVVKIGGQLVELSAREIGLLEIFLLRVGRLVSKDQLVDHLCGWGEEVSSNAIEVYVHRLRKKLEDSGVRIVTVRGLGYCLENPDAAPAAKVQA